MLYDIVTPPKLLELFFDDVLVQMIFGYTKLNSNREKADISFKISNEKIRLFLSMLLLSGCHGPPDHKMYWEATPATFVKAKSDSVSRNKFERIPRNLHFCENDQLDK